MIDNTDSNGNKDDSELQHDPERFWRIIALAVAAVVIVGGVLFMKKPADNDTNAEAISNSNIGGTSTTVDDKADEAYSIYSPLPEDRINTKIKEICPNETYVIKNRSVGTDTSGNPYADYECVVTSGRELTFTAKDYVVDDNGTKRRGFTCDYVKKVADTHKKAVEDVLNDSGISYSVERDGMTYDVSVPDDSSIDKFAKAFVEIATEYAGTEANYNTRDWLDKTKVISFVPTGTTDGGSKTISCTSEIPDVASVSQEIKQSVGNETNKSKTALENLIKQYNDTSNKDKNAKSTKTTAVARLITQYNDDRTAVERLVEQYNREDGKNSKTDTTSLSSTLAQRSGTAFRSRIGGAARLRSDLMSNANMTL